MLNPITGQKPLPGMYLGRQCVLAPARLELLQLCGTGVHCRGWPSPEGLSRGVFMLCWCCFPRSKCNQLEHLEMWQCGCERTVQSGCERLRNQCFGWVFWLPNTGRCAYIFIVCKHSLLTVSNVIFSFQYSSNIAKLKEFYRPDMHILLWSFSFIVLFLVFSYTIALKL